ncbi:MAG: hypothetical protein V3G42_02215 [Oscillospiraceae bacterium]
MDATKFNDSLSPMAQAVIVDFRTFKNIHIPIFEGKRGKKQSIEEVIATIKYVLPRTNGITIVFESGRKIDCYFNGTYVKYDRTGRLSSVGGVFNGKCIENQHVKIWIEGQAIFLERLIAIATDIMQNSMPVMYQSWEANVMDGSGSIKTAVALGIPSNYSPFNIEWCQKSDNVIHGSMLIPMLKRTGHVYQYSARDMELRQIFDMQDDYLLKKYCAENLPQIR